MEIVGQRGQELTGLPNNLTRIEINYNYFDLSPYLEGTYYRLKQTDYDGTTTYSDIISVGCKDTKEQEFEYVNMIGKYVK